MGDNPGFDLTKPLPWIRRSIAKITALATPLGRGELMADENGRFYGGDGTTPVKNLSPFATKNDLTNGYLPRPAGGNQGQALLRDSTGSGYWGSVGSSVSVTDNGDGTFNLAGVGVTPNDDGTYTIAS